MIRRGGASGTPRPLRHGDALGETSTSGPAADPTAAPRGVIVLRALPGLGDMLCAGPALRSVRAGLPRAHLALVVLPGTQALALRVLPMIDEAIAFPGCPGIPERPVPDPPWPAFEGAMRARRWDLAVQMHGDGSHLDAFMPRLAARRSTGYRPGGGDGRDWFAYPSDGHEILRWTALTARLGLPPAGADLRFDERRGDRAALGVALDRPLPHRGYACLHPGASTPARRWPAARFASVADAVAARGLAVVLTGTADEAPVTAAVARAMRAPALDLAGRTPLGALALLLADAALLVTNDTGVAHLAAATRTPSVTVFLAADPARWAPLDRARHRIVVARPLWRGADPLQGMRLSRGSVPTTAEVLAEVGTLAWQGLP